MNRFKCPACGGNQYTACDTAEKKFIRVNNFDESANIHIAIRNVFTDFFARKVNI